METGGYLVSARSSVLLQTASGHISDNKEKLSASVNILLDLGSQRTYITNRVVQKLRLESVGAEMMTVNTFGNRQGRTTLMKEYAFCVRNKKRGCNMYMRGFGVPYICSPLMNQNLDVAVDMYPLLKDIELSYLNEGSAEVDLLIGADFYWGVVGDEFRRINESGLTAIDSKLGWLLSGPVQANESNDVARVSCFFRQYCCG